MSRRSRRRVADDTVQANPGSAPLPTTVGAANLDFLKPFKANNIAGLTLAPRGASTAVTWAMIGRRPFSHKCIGTIFNMDKMVGGEFAKGLAELKAMAER